MGLLLTTDRSNAIRETIEQEKCDLVVLPHWETGASKRLVRLFFPSILEQASCPVLVLKGTKWLTASKAERPGLALGQRERPAPS